VYIKDFYKYIPSKAVPALISFFIIMIYSRLLSPSEYGTYILLMNLIMLSLNFSAAWIGMTILRYHPKFIKKNKKGLHNAILRLTIISTTITMVVLIPVSYIIMQQSSDLTVVTMLITLPILLFLLSFHMTFQFLFRIRREIGWFNLATIYESAVKLTIPLVLILLFGFGIEGIFLGFTAGVMISVVPFYIKAYEGYMPRNDDRKFGIEKKMIRYGTPLIISMSAFWFLNLSDRFILLLLASSNDVGVYSANYDLIEKSLNFIIILTLLPFTPIVMKKWENDGVEKTRKFIENFSRYYFSLLIIAVFLYILYLEPILELLIDPEYHDGIEILPFIALSLIFFGLFQLYQYGLLFHERTDLISRTVIIAALVNITLNIILIPEYGYMAAAWSTLFSTMILSTIVYYYSRVYFKFTIKASILIIMLFSCFSSALIGYVMIKFIDLPELLESIIGIAVTLTLFLIMVIGLKLFNLSEIKKLMLFSP